MAELTIAQQRIMQRLSATRQSVVPLDVIQRELQMDPKETAAALRGLLEDQRVAVRRGGSGEDRRLYVSLAADLSEHAELVLSTIRASGTSGIDQAQLVSKVRITKSEVLKILATLIENKHIKERRSFSNRAKRIYLLFNVEPSAHVTGGSFYCGEELDVAYIDELRRRLVAYVAEQRVVTMSQIKAFLDDQHISGSADSGVMHTTAGASSPSSMLMAAMGDTTFGPNHATAESFYDLSSPISFVNEHAPQQSQLSFPTEPTTTTTPGAVGAGHAAAARSPSSGSPASLSALLSQHVGEGGVSRPAPQLPARTLSDRDVQILTHSLILDGVLEEIAPGALTDLAAHSAPASSSAGLRDVMLGNDFSFMDDDALDTSTGARLGATGGSAGASGGGIGGIGGGASLTSDASTLRHYQLAPAGANVVRHFSAMRKRTRDGSWRQRSTSSNADGGSGSTLLRLGQHSADLEVERRGEAHRTPAQARLATAMRVLKDEGLYIPSSLSEQTIAASSGGGYMPAVGFPCLGCPQLAQCAVMSNSLLNVHRCSYLKEWLGE